MRRIGVIGNSHLAAYKLGWEILKDRFADYELVFFGSPTTSMRFLKVDGGNLVPTSPLTKENLKWTSETYDYIPGDLDAYICVGMGFSFVHLMALLDKHRTIDGYDPSSSSYQLVSWEFLTAAMHETLFQSNAVGLLQMLSEISSAPKAYAPNPFPTTEVLSDERYTYFLNDRVRDRVFDFYQSSKFAAFKDLCDFVEQPGCTLEQRVFTKGEYSRGSVKLKKGLRSQHEANDYFHMNAEFGAVALAELLCATG
ncbi:hypothetical protein [Cognatazoarcus halotolerans]|uniref:hypothetical protein n=1 Tax=Cognatazoarcus halotolerans TaxID=2686016 RepID=UPI001358A45E|nr:hypothetical protein [Cognatazoarcus halotolerans]MCP5311094.1 hypothetical protein [Zoogloeaceae bacterium]